MKTFNQFIAEAQEVHKFSDTILTKWNQAPFILRSKLWTTIFPEYRVREGWHVTDYAGLMNLIKRKGKKNSISTFNKSNDMHILYGIETEGGVVIKVKGKSSGNFGFDAWTARTDKGYRTILLGTVNWDGLLYTYFFKRGFTKEQLIIEKMRDWLKGLMPEFARLNGLDLNQVSEWTGQEKRKAIKYYLDMSEAYIKKFGKDIKAAFSLFDETDMHGYNEEVLEYFTIEKIYFIEDSIEDYKIYGQKKELREYEEAYRMALKNKIPTQLLSMQKIESIVTKDLETINKD